MILSKMNSILKKTITARQHNNANVLCMPERFVEYTTAQSMTELFLSTPFEGGRHERRVAKI